ncbi:TPA: hypothetical protein H1016_03380 [archaeon]|uniref:2TM domain-containing protein n=1 Tax=Candidatus Naiadarchaeum limnaeum TaxID=2756139 RepID=A0A832V5D1_9ARCH|nr:hypothetical protein [Candidatus Naiadarchaeum limnaeum]
MPRKKRITLKRIKKSAIEETRKAHNQLRIVTISIYIILFASWIIWKYDMIYLVLGIVTAMFLRLGMAYWLFKKKFPPGKKK